MDTFSTVRFKIKVANRFRKFSIQVARTHTEALESMLDFFEVHQLSPLDSIDGSLSAVEIRIKRRISNAIAIIKDIEKNQTLPTVAMLQSLFQEQFEPGEEDSDFEDDFGLIEKKFENVNEEEELLEEISVPKILYERLEYKMDELKKDFGYVLEKVKAVRNNFGKDYLKLEISIAELEKYKRKVNNS
ncbi:MAG: BfmA/BtgA family mobilization protein [Flavobacteriaceae bacterium]